MLICVLTLMGCQSTGDKIGKSRGEIDREVDMALKELYATTPAARNVARRAKGILVFPNVLKAGFLFGAKYARGGALRKNGVTAGYYNSLSGSYGLQAGVQSFGYALFFMNDAALSYLESSEGWEIGVGPSVTIVDEGIARTLTTTTGRHNIYAFIFGQKGLMAGMGIEGTKITKIHPH